ncbi:IS4 family transposase [Myroides odoratimimus]|uniref:Transposase n=1 Tax=Myroides odoratimimus TaxID=76832 RepID=A0AAI8C8R1_9FLAO|nr:IS4 family transposase [Myroides odoratimimus]ALU28119.1 transposase [Myroides odoratimimus]MDM1039475.1 IS4 family transposase [Myroides odoratimimus]MDM1053705.1 IS4 family transposase [Myroides odoratimimus]MDM1411496.1 IS4 family transposase [Myroides odoratimimus]MDM1460342.1 IS4 family transposase [Myroides odoratimimus]
MNTFKDHKITVGQILQFIPEALLTKLSSTTSVDKYAKVLHGKKMFYLLLYSILENDRLSQRSLEDTFNGSIFKALFDLDENEKVRRSSISDRFSKIDSDFFKTIYENIYEQFSSIYSKKESEGYNIIRVDSTLVSETAGKLVEGLDYKTGKKHIKYSTLFDGILPCGVETFNTSSYSSEELALPEAILKHVEKDKNHNNIYVIDRGLQSTRTMQDFTSKNIPFIIRSKQNRKFNEIESLLTDINQQESDNYTLIKDARVNLFTGKKITSKTDKTYYREELVEQDFRLVVVKTKGSEQKEFWFLTNDFEMAPFQVADYYKSRWDIEVFFRFLKQELNTAHLVSLNKNGTQVMIYMTLIAAMLLLIYKHANNLGYKTAKRRFNMELKNLIIALIVALTGGDPNKVPII